MADLYLPFLQHPEMKKVLDGLSQHTDLFRRQKGSRYHPARSCRDLQLDLDSDDTVHSGRYREIQLEQFSIVCEKQCWIVLVLPTLLCGWYRYSAQLLRPMR